MDIFTAGKALEREATPKPRSSRRPSLGRGSLEHPRSCGSHPRCGGTPRALRSSAPGAVLGAHRPLLLCGGDAARRSAAQPSSLPRGRPAALAASEPRGGLGGYGRSIGGQKVQKRGLSRPREGDPSVLCQPLGAGVIRTAGSGLKRGRRGGSETGRERDGERSVVAAAASNRGRSTGSPAAAGDAGARGFVSPSADSARVPQTLSRSRPPTSRLPNRLGSSPPARPSARPVPPAPLGRRGPGSPEPCPSGGPARCGCGRPGRAGGAEGPRGLRAHRPAAGRRLPLGGTGPGPRHRSSTPFRRRSLAFLRQRRFGLSRAAFLTHGRVHRRQDEGRAAAAWKDARERGGELGGNRTQTNQGWKKKRRTPYAGRGRRPLTVVNSSGAAPFLCHMA
ncbi:uncharacterized protein LOC110398184 [Numida meleagris]|uniref:uncharacterized protein LOC110398184 n=1 Tax=Numida meleagris TaxID=8996 RepID=UPI000B3D8CE7|nr:uncharacterized protein LOC110398184 [Numida meleagris]